MSTNCPVTALELINPDPKTLSNQGESILSTMGRRSFMNASAAILAGAALPRRTNGEPAIPGFDQTKTDYDKTKVWKEAWPA